MVSNRKGIIITNSVCAILNYRKEAARVKLKTGQALKRAEPALLERAITLRNCNCKVSQIASQTG